MEKLARLLRGPMAMMRRLPLFLAVSLLSAATLASAGEPPPNQPVLRTR